MANDINIRLLRQTISAQAAKQIGNLADSAIKVNFETKKKLFLQEFDRHPVTQELNAASDNPMLRSNIIPRGNLFSFIGFDQGAKPAEELREYLDEKIKLRLNSKKTKVVGNRIVIETAVEMPTLAEIDANMKASTPEWSPRAWTELLRKGITGFGQFVARLLASPYPSRSGGGIQHPDKDRQLSGSVKSIKYVDELLARFRSLIGGKA